MTAESCRFERMDDDQETEALPGVEADHHQDSGDEREPGEAPSGERLLPDEATERRVSRGSRNSTSVPFPGSLVSVTVP